MAQLERQFPRKKHEFSPLTYSEYTQQALKDLPPNPVLPGQIVNNNIHNRSSNPGNTKNGNGNNAAATTNVINKTSDQNLIVVLNVIGTRFEISRGTYDKLEPSILGSGDDTLVQINPTTGYPEIFVERNPVCFAAILDYYRCGELHMPNEICPSVFKRELNYWGIASSLMESCCLRKYAAFHSNEQTLSSCHETFTQWRDNRSTHSATRWGQIRRKGWAIMDDPKSGPLAKIYLCVASIFVVLSIFLLAAASDDNFRRQLNSNEWEEFMSYDDLWAYWDYIYPGKTKPDRQLKTSQNLGAPAGFFGFSTTVSPPPSSGNSAPSGGVGRRRRSASGDPNTADTGAGQVNTRANKVMPNTVEDSQNQERGTGATLDNARDVASDTENQYVVDDVRKALTEYIQNLKLPNNMKPIAQEIVKEMDGDTDDIQIVKELIKTPIKQNKNQELLNVFQELKDEILNSYAKESVEDIYTPLDFTDEYPIRPDAEAPGQESPEFEQPRSFFTNLQNEQQPILQRRKRASGSGSNDTTASNITDGSWNIVNATELYNAECVFMSGDSMRLLVDYLLFTSEPITNSSTRIGLPTATTVYKWVDILENICMAYFTIEFILRVLFAPSVLRYMCSFLTLMDLISLATMYTALLVEYQLPELKYTESAMDAVNCFQITRVFRFFRLVKDVIGFRVLLLSVRTSWKELLLLLLYIMMAVTIFATIVFFCERDNMKSIPEAAWWAIVTMTTVGYGDMYPKTLQGRLTGMACAMSGVLLIAVTVPIFVNNFILFYEYSKISMDSDFYTDPKKNDEKEEKKNKTTTNGTTNDQEKNRNHHHDKDKENDNDNNDKARGNLFRHRTPRSNTLSTGKLFQQTSSKSNTTSNIGLEPVSSPSSSPTYTEPDTTSIYSRTDSSKSLLSPTSTTASSKSLKSAASVSKVEPIVYDLELEQDKNTTGGTDNPVFLSKPPTGTSRKTNQHNKSLA